MLFFLRIVEDNMSNFFVDCVAADGLASFDSRTSAGAVMTKCGQPWESEPRWNILTKLFTQMMLIHISIIISIIHNIDWFACVINHHLVS